MKEWIFKIIYIPIMASLLLANASIMWMIVKEAGFKAPYAWLLVIGCVAYAADWYVNKQ